MKTIKTLLKNPGLYDVIRALKWMSHPNSYGYLCTDHHFQGHTPPHVQITTFKDTHHDTYRSPPSRTHAITRTGHHLQGHTRHCMYRSPPSRTYTPPHQHVSPYLQTHTFYHIFKQKNCTLTFKINLFLQPPELNTPFYIILRSVSRDKCYITPARRSLLQETYIVLHNRLNSIHYPPSQGRYLHTEQHKQNKRTQTSMS
jgi:hypothetical protein